jgi:HAD superfamily hydrolase (TIGR01509 family)
MKQSLSAVRGIIFDYGGTIDTPALHWSEVLWQGYTHVGVPVTKEQFREAYVQGERTLDREPLVQPNHNFHDLLLIKVEVEMDYLLEQAYWTVTEPRRKRAIHDVADYCYSFVLRTLTVNREVLRKLSERYPMVLVSNFYGNIRAILRDFHLDFFDKVVESAVVGIRKPDPGIYDLGIKALNLLPDEIVVVGDSYKKDVLPANQLGCHTVWLKGIGWAQEEVDESVPDAVIKKLSELPELLGVV